MAEFDSNGRPLVTVVRVLEYHGTQEWISAVFGASRFPPTGDFKQSFDGVKFPEGCFIRSGLVQWTDEQAAGQGKGNEPKAPIPTMPPNVM